MPFYIKNPEADQTARLLSRLRGESLTETVLSALREQLEREQAKLVSTSMATDLIEIARRFSGLPSTAVKAVGQALSPADGF